MQALFHLPILILVKRACGDSPLAFSILVAGILTVITARFVTEVQLSLLSVSRFLWCRQSTKAAQEENKQLTELLVQDGGIMALFAKESDDVNGTGSPAAGSSDQSTADSAAERGETSHPDS